MIDLSDSQKIGIGLLGLGGLFFIIGILLFLDRYFLTMGNIMFLTGLLLVVGLQKALSFFLNRRKIKGTICFALGVFLVLFKHPIIGTATEIFGFVNLFGDFIPTVISFIRKLPVIGDFLNIPGVSHVVDLLAGPRGLPV